MKNLVIGLVLGLGASGGAYYLASPKIKQASYDEGYKVGNAEGMEKGKQQGVEEGKEQGISLEKVEEAKVVDSMASVLKAKAAAEAARRAAFRQKEKKPEIENWHVVGGHLADPIVP